MLYGGFAYQNTSNLGDEIQSIAAERFLPRIDERFHRDTLSGVSSANRYLLIMNGWFTHQPDLCFPPSNAIYPVFWGMHVTDWNSSWDRFLSTESIKYLKAHEPIGCRDEYTQKKLEQSGIRSFYSKCLSLTFPKREKAPEYGWNVIVDVPVPLPQFIEENGLRVTHAVKNHISGKARMDSAQRLLELYKNNASLVVTTRLHCALPCISMGIPTVFLGSATDYRVSILKDIGLPINELPKTPNTPENKDQLAKEIMQLWNNTNWQPASLDIETEKEQLIANFQRFLQEKISRFKQQ